MPGMCKLYLCFLLVQVGEARGLKSHMHSLHKGKDTDTFQAGIYMHAAYINDYCHL